MSAPQAVGAVLALIVAVVVLRKCLGADDNKTANPAGPGEVAAAPAGVAAAPADLPWLSTVRAACASYKAAPNEIKKSAIFNDVTELLAKTSIHGARGKLSRLKTNKGGAELALAIKIGDATFATESLFAPIVKGSPVYLAAGEMTVGQCVIFDADKLRPSSLVEQSQVCDADYFASVTSIAPCP